MQEWDARRCPGCGDDITETTKDEHDGAYRAQLPVRCHRCHSLYDATDLIHAKREDGSDAYPQPRALSIPIVLRK